MAKQEFIVATLVATVLLVGSIGGVALAQTENGGDTQPFNYRLNSIDV